MAGHSVIHDTFRIERTYEAAPATVFAAFSTEEARSSWGETDEVELPGEDGGDNEPSEFDFRPGGRERFSVKVAGTAFRYDARYYDMEAPTMREAGTMDMLNGLTAYLRRHEATR